MSADEQPLRVQYIGAPWCGVCKVVRPAIDALAARFGVPVDATDLEELPEAEQEAVTKVPTVRLRRGAAVLAEVTTKHVDALRELLAAHATPAASTDDF
jgi:thiol-disulfide isomerase/thioredoxin